MVRRTVLAGCVALLAATLAVTPARAAPTHTIITTIAGTGDGYAYGDGGPAKKAGLPAPESMAFAPDGTLYVVSGQQIRAIAPDGTIRTVAGTGEKGFSGDGGPAVKATLSLRYHPASGETSGIAVGPDGTLYIADTNNNRIRAVDPDSHKITTVAGSSANEPGHEFTGDGGPADKATLSIPRDIAVADDGTLYIADTGNFKMRAVDPTTHIIRTAAGGHETQDWDAAGGTTVATQSVVHPISMAIDNDGTVYFAESSWGKYRIRALDSKKGRLKIVVGKGGEAPLDGLSEIDSIALADDTLYISGRLDHPDDGVVCTTPLGNHSELTRLAGRKDGKHIFGAGQSPRDAYFGVPPHVAIRHDGTVYLADAAMHRVRSIRQPSPAPTAGHPGEQIVSLPADSSLGDPASIAVAADGTVYELDTSHHVVKAIEPSGQVRTVAGTGNKHSADGVPASGQATDLNLGDANQIALGPHDRRLYIATDADIYVMDPEKGTIHRFAKMNLPARGMAVDAYGGVYVAHGGRIDRARHDLLRSAFDNAATGDRPRQWSPAALAFGPHGVCYVANGNVVYAVDVKTGLARIVAGYSGWPATSDDAATSADGIPAISARLYAVSGLAVAPDGTLYIADQAVHRIRAVDPRTGTISTVAGGGSVTYRSSLPTHYPGGGRGGDGGPARHARLDNPSDVAIGPHGAVYIADTNNGRIRVIGPLPKAPAHSVWYLAGAALLVALLVAGALLFLWYRRKRRRTRATAEDTDAAPTAGAQADSGPDADSDNISDTRTSGHPLVDTETDDDKSAPSSPTRAGEDTASEHRGS